MTDTLSPLSAAGTGAAEPVRTAANLVTLVRTAVAVGLGVAALHEASMPLLVAGYAVYWVGDTADGMVARWRNEETRQGAVFDIVSDRACSSVLAAAFLLQVPEAALALGVWLFNFMVLDAMLTLSFLHWPLVSPNYFHRVDRTVYRLNWSPVAKASNTSVVVLLILVGWTVPALVVALGVVGVKLWSGRRVIALLDGR